MLQYNNVDARLEELLNELYTSHKARAANIDWSYHEFIPWEKARCFKKEPWDESQRTLPLPIYTAIETALLTEVNLPWFTTHLSITFKGALEVLKEFIHTWTAEEDQHSTLLETYLIITRNANPHQLKALRKQVVEQGFESEFTAPTQVMAYTAMQELATLVYYNNVAKVAQPYDKDLAALLRRLAKDESLHYAFYRDAVKAHLELEPNYIYHVGHVILNFGMPGRKMPDFDERMKMIGQEANYGPEQYFMQVLDVLVEFWDVANLQPTEPEAEEMRLAVLKHHQRLKKIIERANARKKETTR
ncbi:acyl-ACP desaturase [Ammoniphilus resinae]|uniref:Acyl-[acyl-carrier-protein] desaturase n=1 Tax=Ammoniphilus resinae TaxID=861532 RepID=A0ABS4GUI9_9BACL|nr:acyl-ACP desaturase [Ammoniphilus resinae]MBP1933923.1 acyl-[acyl-carrier-protein] desaturase [Ammoniphilus resinae]